MPALPNRRTMFQLSNLHFTYPASPEPVLTNCSATFPPGITLVRGGDGRGKTTLLRLLAGDLKADSGWLELDGTGLQDQPALYQAQVFWQDPRSDAHDALLASEYLNQAKAKCKTLDSTLLAHLLAGLSLGPHLGKQLFMLSTGSKRKVFLAAAIASGARLTLLDMPFAALDKPSIGFLIQTLAAEARKAERIWVLADYEAPVGLPLAAELNLGD
jgi:ABC-type multidrug transport system ATPase subunit